MTLLLRALLLISLLVSTYSTWSLASEQVHDTTTTDTASQSQFHTEQATEVRSQDEQRNGAVYQKQFQTKSVCHGAGCTDDDTYTNTATLTISGGNAQSTATSSGGNAIATSTGGSVTLSNVQITITQTGTSSDVSPSSESASGGRDNIKSQSKSKSKFKNPLSKHGSAGCSADDPSSTNSVNIEISGGDATSIATSSGGSATATSTGGSVSLSDVHITVIQSGAVDDESAAGNDRDGGHDNGNSQSKYPWKHPQSSSTEDPNYTNTVNIAISGGDASATSTGGTAATATATGGGVVLMGVTITITQTGGSDAAAGTVPPLWTIAITNNTIVDANGTNPILAATSGSPGASVELNGITVSVSSGSESAVNRTAAGAGAGVDEPAAPASTEANGKSQSNNNGERQGGSGVERRLNKIINKP